jgi:hypothetical protein
MIREDYGALQFLERIRAQKECPELQVILRLHPGFKEEGCTELEKIRTRFPDVVIQGPHRFWKTVPYQSRASILEWVNTLRHANVVINLSSTIAVDASIFDRPVVNIDFDPEPGAPNRQVVKEANRKWEHFAPIAQSGGLWLVNNIEELVTATKTYLKSPDLHRDKRRWIVESVCDRVDGQSGKRFAEAIAQLMNLSPQPCQADQSGLLAAG